MSAAVEMNQARGALGSVLANECRRQMQKGPTS